MEESDADAAITLISWLINANKQENSTGNFPFYEWPCIILHEEEEGKIFIDGHTWILGNGTAVVAMTSILIQEFGQLFSTNHFQWID